MSPARAAIIRALAVGALTLGAAPVSAATVAEVHYVMGTYFRITADLEAARPAMRRCFQEARRLDGIFSRYDAASELTAVNAARGRPQRVSPDFARLLARAQALAAATGGAFDVTVGPLTALWRRQGEMPTPAEVARARAPVGYRRVELRRGEVVRLPRGGRLDFDGIAKGYAVDACVAILRAGGVRRALVNLGESSLYALGAPPGERHWRLALRGSEPGRVVGTLALRDQAVSVSETFGGVGRAVRRTAHIIDPRTGVPLGEPAVAVVVAASATDAEAYTKALLLWGAPGVARVERLGARAVHLAAGGVRQGRAASREHVFRPLAAPRPIPAALDEMP